MKRISLRAEEAEAKGFESQRIKNNKSEKEELKNSAFKQTMENNHREEKSTIVQKNAQKQELKVEREFSLREVQRPKFMEKPLNSFSSGNNRKRIIAVSSSGKGGTGKSTTSLMLALFYQELNKNTALVDMDIPFGDIASMLGMSNDRCISDFNDIPSDLSDIKVRDNMLLTYHNGLKVLPALRNLNEQSKVNSASFVDKLLSKLESFDTIVVDLGPNFEALTLRVLEQATDIVYVTDDYETTFHNIFLGKNVLTEKGIDTKKLRLVINKSTAKNDKERDVRATNVGKITGIKNIYFLPIVVEMPKLVDSSNYLVLEENRHPYRKYVHDIIKDLSPELFTERNISHYKPKKRGLFAKMLGGKK
ncbi:AAA family ATPase [Virgibacillus halodenitrificans]|uniref:AAA family ATPase n=1 Tax=Virgibacillus halodenitrificans TaxID=1482 RepID=UPI000EF52076|nr:P-loop NTPase [Virgibacillus halodenitrificans]